jgi:tetratricopeptide (TPR) repeat protein
MSVENEEKQIKNMLSLFKTIRKPESYQQIIKVASKNLGDIYLQSKQTDLAEKLYLISNFIVQNDSGSFANLAKFYYENDNTDKAYNFINKAVQLNPEDKELALNAGIISADCGKSKEAENFYNSVLITDSVNHKAKFGLAVENFKKGNLLDAYRLFQNRHLAFNTDSMISPELLSIPKWDGKSKGKLVVYNEQGYGDFIFGMRYLELLDTDFYFYIDQNINSLLKNTIYESLNKRVLKKVQYRCSILDIPSYYECESYKNDAYGKIFKTNRNKKPKYNIGLVFSGGKSYSADKRRSIKLSKFNQILNNKLYKVTLFQKQTADNEYFDIELPNSVKICKCSNFYTTANELQNMDCLVTVDTSVAHLAGALNIPAFVLLDKYPDYRWWLSEKNTLWYKSWRLYKQKTRGNWDDPIESVVKDLSEFFNDLLRNCR